MRYVGKTRDGSRVTKHDDVPRTLRVLEAPQVDASAEGGQEARRALQTTRVI